MGTRKKEIKGICFEIFSIAAYLLLLFAVAYFIMR